MLVDIHSHRRGRGKNSVVYNLLIEESECLNVGSHEGFFSFGFHPWFLETYSLEKMNLLEKLCDVPGFVAIGECGLDKKSKTELKEQIKIFEKQVRLSEEKKKAVIIHCVGCFNELFELKKTWKPEQKWIIHGFRNKPQLAEQALKTGCCLSYGEFFNEESVRITPTENLFLETDESTLSIEAIYERIATIKSLAVEDLSAGNRLLQEYY